MSLWSRISNAVFGERLNREIDEELQSHIEEAIASGRDPKEARRAFGCTLHAREASHSIRVVGWLESLLSDISFGWRQLCRNKVTSASAVLSLALGIGSCVADAERERKHGGRGRDLVAAERSEEHTTELQSLAY